MDFSIRSQGREVVVVMPGPVDEHEAILGVINECRGGRCGCPVREYQKLEALEVGVEEEQVVLRLRVMEGQTLSMPEIERCVAWTMQNRAHRLG